MSALAMAILLLVPLGGSSPVRAEEPGNVNVRALIPGDIPVAVLFEDGVRRYETECRLLPSSVTDVTTSDTPPGYGNASLTITDGLLRLDARPWITVGSTIYDFDHWTAETPGVSPTSTTSRTGCFTGLTSDQMYFTAHYVERDPVLATITVEKEYADASTDPVRVTLTCTGGTIDEDVRSAAPGSPAIFTIEDFEAGVDSCTAEEEAVPGYRASYEGDCEDVTLAPGGSYGCTITNTPGSGALVTAGSCAFDRDANRALQQFPLIFTPSDSATSFKLNATAPGQFFLNVVSTGDESPLEISIPYPFVTAGANPIRVFDLASSALVASPKPCVTRGDQLWARSDQVRWTASAAFGDEQTITIDTGGRMVLVTVHLDYGLKGVVDGCTADGSTPPQATCQAPRTNFVIPGYQSYSFGFSSQSESGGTTIESYNAFKKIRGFGGLVLQRSAGDPVAGAAVQVFDAKNKLVATTHTDSDGWYAYPYKYTGKAATFTLRLPAYGLQQQVTLKSNGYVVSSFAVLQ